MKKVVYIIPGHSEKTKDKSYQKIASFFKKQAINPRLIDIHWKYRTMSDYVNEFKSKYKKEKNTESYFLGFSFGAMISFISAQELKPKKIIFCSLSPYFKEDLPNLKKSWKKYIGKKMKNDLKTYEFNKIIKNIKSQSVFLVGGKEPEILIEKSRKASKIIKKSKLIIIPNTKHRIRQEEYLKEIENQIKQLGSGKFDIYNKF